jgi:RNA polymerase sigma-70 factor (ECF subfamily)
MKPRPASSATELDELTVARAQRGDDAACRALVVAYQRPVFALLSRMCAGDRRGSVEDLAQDTFLRVFQALPRFSLQGPARLSTWILTIATRVALDELRRARPRWASLDDAAQVPSPESSERRALGRAIAAAVAGLAPEYRAAFVLRAYHDLEYEEIARALEIDLGTVKSRLSRARGALRSVLGDQDEQE